MTEKEWNSVKWEPSFARPDKLVGNLSTLLRPFENENDTTKLLNINEEAFNIAENNIAFAQEFKLMDNFDERLYPKAGSCDSTKISRRFDSGYSKRMKRKEKCNSLFNAKSTRAFTDFQPLSSDKTTVDEVGLRNWQVRSFGPVYHVETSPPLFYMGPLMGFFIIS